MAQINELQAAIASNSAGPLENEDVQKLAVENIKLKHRLSILDNVSLFLFVLFVLLSYFWLNLSCLGICVTM